ncbi:hypothetical protein SBA4_5490009 [Candidatus Sulfopaludibacter sp. SbA4]|nr:hypothetical protein SBA4_5490009 [Candidatus Sulfopaludibacter sp. SbA4]
MVWNQWKDEVENISAKSVTGFLGGGGFQAVEAAANPPLALRCKISAACSGEAKVSWAD